MHIMKPVAPRRLNHPINTNNKDKNHECLIIEAKSDRIQIRIESAYRQLWHEATRGVIGPGAFKYNYKQTMSITLSLEVH